MPSSLAGKLLVAMPSMGDTRFSHAVVFICAHSEEGAMGLIVNKTAPEVAFSDLAEQLGIAIPIGREIRVHFGGPVENGRGFVLHSADYSSPNGTMEVDPQISMTATIDVLEEMANGTGPVRSMLALGYAGWGPGQLEDEIAENAWIVGDADEDILFGLSNDGKWSAALQHVGVDPRLISSQSGRA